MNLSTNIVILLSYVLSSGLGFVLGCILAAKAFRRSPLSVMRKGKLLFLEQEALAAYFYEVGEDGKKGEQFFEKAMSIKKVGEALQVTDKELKEILKDGKQLPVCLSIY